MAKRASPNEEPFRPLLERDLVTAALAGVTQSPVALPGAKGSHPTTIGSADLPRTDLPRRVEQIRPRSSSPQSVLAASSGLDSLVEKFDHEKRILLTRGESHATDRLITELAHRIGAQVKISHVIRGLIALLLNAEAEIDRRAGEAAPLSRPANGDAQALQRFEQAIGAILASGIRDAGRRGEELNPSV